MSKVIKESSSDQKITSLEWLDITEKKIVKNPLDH